MNKRQTRAFFFAGSGICAVMFLGMTVDTHRQLPKLTNADKITPDVIEGKHVWHRNDCINCHTLLGEGAYYAPDLTKITQQRGAPYLKAFLQNPSQFYSEEKDRRIMPNPNLTDRQIDQVIAFLDWVGHIDTQGWPPRPIIVSGASIPVIATVGEQAAPSPASNNPITLGEALFHKSPPGCFACHSTTAGVNLVGPTLADIAETARKRIADSDYDGKATDAQGYIHESIVDPNAFVLEGPTYSSGGRSLMPTGLENGLTPEQIDDIVAYLMSLR